MMRKIFARFGGLLVLLALAQIAAPEAPIVAGIAGAPSAAAQIINYPTTSSRKPRFAPKRVVCVGDSIMVRYCNMRVTSPIFYGMMGPGGTPRRFAAFKNFAVSGSRSGTETGYTAVDGTDLNTPAKIAQVIAASPDQVLILVGGNTSTNSLTDVFNNVRAFAVALMQANPNIEIVLFTSPPQSRGSAGANIFLENLRSQYEGLATEFPNNVTVYDTITAAIDDQTSHCPQQATSCLTTGGSNNVSTAQTEQGASPGQHPSGLNAQNQAVAFTGELADNLGWPKKHIGACDLNNRYNSSTNPGGCMFGGIGVMYGSSTSGIGANMVGGSTTVQDNVTTSNTMSISTSNAELSCTSSVGGSLTYLGNTFRALHLVCTSTGAFSANRSVSLTRTASQFSFAAGSQSSVPLQCSILVSLTSPVGLTGTKFTIQATIAGAGSTLAGEAGGQEDIATVANEMPGGLYTLYLVDPVNVDGGTALNFTLAFNFRSGAGGTGTTVLTADVAQLDCAANYVNP